jgi:hypothetical protein
MQPQPLCKPLSTLLHSSKVVRTFDAISLLVMEPTKDKSRMQMRALLTRAIGFL